MTSSEIEARAPSMAVEPVDDGMSWLAEANPATPTSVLDEVGSAARLALFAAVRRSFDELNKRERFTRRSVAERISSSPELVARLLRSPTNMTIETAAKLLFAMGKELSIRAVDPADKVRVVACIYDKSQSIHADHAKFTALGYTIVHAVTDKIDSPHAFLAFPRATTPSRVGRALENQRIEIRSNEILGAPFSVLPVKEAVSAGLESSE